MWILSEIRLLSLVLGRSFIYMINAQGRPVIYSTCFQLWKRLNEHKSLCISDISCITSTPGIACGAFQTLSTFSSSFLLYCKIESTLMACIRIALALCKSKNRHAELETKKKRVCVYLGIWASHRSLKTHVCGVLAGPNLAVILCFLPVGDRLQRRYRGPGQS